MKAIDPKRLAFADAVQAEVSELELRLPISCRPTRINWLLAGLRAHLSESVLDIIATAEELYQDEVRHESARKAAKGVTT